MTTDNPGHDHHEDPNEAKLQKRLMGLSIVLTIILGVVCYLLLMPAWYQNYAPEQPIPFSHQIHAGKFKIPCGYCHGSAESAQFAAVPGLETCMNCHTQVKVDSPWIKQVAAAYQENKPLPWVKVHVLPDFVYFNHGRHVAAGVQCQTCHGPVETMDKVYQFSKLNMGWCMECHRNNNYLTDARKEFFAKKAELQGRGPQSKIEELIGHPEMYNADISCSTCHR